MRKNHSSAKHYKSAYRFWYRERTKNHFSCLYWEMGATNIRSSFSLFNPINSHFCFYIYQNQLELLYQEKKIQGTEGARTPAIKKIIKKLELRIRRWTSTKLNMRWKIHIYYNTPTIHIYSNTPLMWRLPRPSDVEYSQAWADLDFHIELHAPTNSTFNPKAY